MALKREKSNNYDQNRFVPVTFIDDEMTNSTKTEEQKDGKYPETKGAKRADLTSRPQRGIQQRNIKLPPPHSATKSSGRDRDGI